MPNYYDDERYERYEDEVSLPGRAFCLRVPGTDGEELVVHREGNEDFVFLFEAGDDAADYARAAERALGFAPEIGPVHTGNLHFRVARFKPALGEQVDIPLRR